MAWYKNLSDLTGTTGTGTWWTSTYGPADEVPVSGIYKCRGCKKEITSNANDSFPPQNRHQHSADHGKVEWKLIVRTNTEAK
jgi:hypothetical protein